MLDVLGLFFVITIPTGFCTEELGFFGYRPGKEMAHPGGLMGVPSKPSLLNRQYKSIFSGGHESSKLSNMIYY